VIFKLLFIRAYIWIQIFFLIPIFSVNVSNYVLAFL